MKNLSDCRVLLVDDAKANLDILVEGLKADHKLSLALNGEMALQIAALREQITEVPLRACAVLRDADGHHIEPGSERRTAPVALARAAREHGLDYLGDALIGEMMPARLAPEVRERGQPPWAYVDSQPLSRTGAAALTVARLDWGTLRLMHTPRDTPAGHEFRTAEAVGRLVATPI